MTNKEKMKTNTNGQWDIEKIELNLDKEVEEHQQGVKTPEPPFPESPEDKRINAKVSTHRDLSRMKLNAKIKQLHKALNDLKKKSDVGVVGWGKDAKLSSSPAATGKLAEYNMGSTKSGKSISSINSTNSEYTPEDHKDAYFKHGQRANELDPKTTNPDLIQHHKDMAQSHWDSYQAGL